MTPKNIANSSKKHVARLEQVRRQVQLIKMISIAIVALVVGLVGFGILNQTVLLPYRTIVRVNGETVKAGEYQTRARFTRAQLITQYAQLYQLYTLFGGDPSANPQLTGQLQQIAAQLSPQGKEVLGQQVVDVIIESILIEQEAENLGISVSDEEVEAYINQIFDYYPNGTPTPVSPVETPAPEANVTPQPTATPVTYEGYRTMIDEMVKSYNDNNVDVTEADYRALIKAQLLREKVTEYLSTDLKLTEEQVSASHILVSSPEEAVAVGIRLKQGEDFATLAAELSLDTSSGVNGGELGWFGRGRMVAPFEQAAFALEVGVVSEPVQTDFGYHIILVTGHEERPLDQNGINTLKQEALRTWILGLRENADITVNDLWKTIIPMLPDLGS